VDAFETLFPSLSRGQDGYQWDNQYQLQQAVIKVAGWYSFAVKCSGTEIICACSKSHKQLSIAKKINDKKPQPYSLTMTSIQNQRGIGKVLRMSGSPSSSR